MTGMTLQDYGKVNTTTSEKDRGNLDVIKSQKDREMSMTTAEMDHEKTMMSHNDRWNMEGTSQKYHGNGRHQLMYFVMWALAAILCLAEPTTSQTTGGQILTSERCYGTGNCSLHMLNCGPSQRLAILEAAYGFQPSQKYFTCQAVVTNDPDVCSGDCCRYNEAQDCKQKFTSDNLQRVKEYCSYGRSCQIRAQRDTNLLCSDNHAVESTYSVLRAQCIPEAVTVHPCWDVSVSGSLVSLHHTHPSASSDTHSCYCILDAPADSKNTDNSSSSSSNISVAINSYEITSSSSDWSVKIGTLGSPVSFLEYSGAVSKFPAKEERSRETLPLSVRFQFGNVSNTPKRVWLGFQAVTREGDQASLSPSITLRCGQHASQYEQALVTARTSTEALVAEVASTTEENTTLEKTTLGMIVTDSREDNRTQAVMTSKSTNAPPLTSSNTDDSDEGVSIPLVTSMIVLAIVILASVYGIAKRVRKRGWRKGLCCDLEKGPVESRSRSSTVNSDNNTAANTSTDNNNQTKCSNQNGSVPADTEDDEHERCDTKTETETETDYKTYLSHRLSATDWKKYRTGSIASRKSSFGNLELINEAADEPEAPRTDQMAFSHLIASVHERLSRLGSATTTDEEDEEEDTDDTNSNNGGGRLHIYLGPKEHKNNVNITGTVQIFIGGQKGNMSPQTTTSTGNEKKNMSPSSPESPSTHSSGGRFGSRWARDGKGERDSEKTSSEDKNKDNKGSDADDDKANKTAKSNTQNNKGDSKDNKDNKDNSTNIPKEESGEDNAGDEDSDDEKNNSSEDNTKTKDTTADENRAEAQDSGDLSKDSTAASKITATTGSNKMNGKDCNAGNAKDTNKMNKENGDKTPANELNKTDIRDKQREIITMNGIVKREERTHQNLDSKGQVAQGVRL